VIVCDGALAVLIRARDVFPDSDPNVHTTSFLMRIHTQYNSLSEGATVDISFTCETPHLSIRLNSGQHRPGDTFRYNPNRTILGFL
jgi:hypothetical protein